MQLKIGKLNRHPDQMRYASGKWKHKSRLTSLAALKWNKSTVICCYILGIAKTIF